jgi:hypothetical protein
MVFAFIKILPQPASMICYFIKDGDNELGPFTVRQLKRKSITKDTPVWFAGLGEWTTAAQVYELRELFVAKEPSSFFPKSKMNKFWNAKALKLQIKKVAYHLTLIKARKNLY